MKKICVICEICVTKTSTKNLCKSVKSVGQKTPTKNCEICGTYPILWDIFHSQGVSVSTEQVASA